MAFETPYSLADIHAGRRRWLNELASIQATPEALALLAIVALTVFFLLFPNVDIEISDRFYREGEGFPLSQNPMLRLLRRTSTWVMGAALVAAVGVLVLAGIRRAQGRKGPGSRVAAFCLVGLILGPGLVVNGVLKSLWGRPRPLHTELFGADSPYVPVWRMTQECLKNCSFVSGEASSAAWMLSALLLMPARWRAIAALPLGTYAFLISMNRIAFGAHFLSDILLSWAVTGLVLAGLYRVMVTAPILAPQMRPAPIVQPV